MFKNINILSDDLFAPISFGGGGGQGQADSDAAIDRKMNSDNSTTSRSDVSNWSVRDTIDHAARNIGLLGNNYSGSVGGCTGCHQGKYDPVGGSNHTQDH